MKMVYVHAARPSRIVIYIIHNTRLATYYTISNCIFLRYRTHQSSRAHRIKRKINLLWICRIIIARISKPPSDESAVRDTSTQKVFGGRISRASARSPPLTACAVVVIDGFSVRVRQRETTLGVLFAVNTRETCFRYGMKSLK